MTIWEFLIGSLVMLIGSTLQATAGIGQTMVAGPVIASIDAAFIPGPAMLLAVPSNLRNAFGDRDSVDRAALRRSLLAAPIGLALGLVLAGSLSDRAIAIAVSLFVLAAVALQFLGQRPATRPRTDYAAGAATAFSTVSAGLPGPTYAVFYGHRDASMVRATVSRFNIAVMVVMISTMTILSRFGLHELWLTVVFVPAALLGLPIARFLRPRINGPQFRVFILTLASISASIILAKELLFASPAS